VVNILNSRTDIFSVFTKSILANSTPRVTTRKKGNVFRYFGIDAWKNRARDTKKQIISNIGEINFIRH
jgi:hypothetical protein